MIKEYLLTYPITIDTSRIKACHHHPNILTNLMPTHSFNIEGNFKVEVQDNETLVPLPDYDIFSNLAVILSAKNFADCNEDEQNIYEKLAIESLCLVSVYFEYDWQFHFSLLDKEDSEDVCNRQLVNDEIKMVKDLVKLFKIIENFENSVIKISHKDSNSITIDGLSLDKISKKKILDIQLNEKLAEFKRDYAYRHFGSTENSETKMADLVTSNSILGVRMNQGLEFECSLAYFTALLKQISIYDKPMNKRARRIFNSLVAKALLKYLDMLIEEFNVPHEVKLMDKEFYIFSVFRVYGMIPLKRKNLRTDAGNRDAKENHIRDLLKM